MAQMRVSLVLALVFPLLLVGPANATWEFESENMPSGVSPYASTFWLEDVGPITLDDLVQVEDEINERCCWPTLTVSSVKKKSQVAPAAYRPDVHILTPNMHLTDLGDFAKPPQLKMMRCIIYL